MSSRYFLALCALAFVALLVCVDITDAASEELDDRASAGAKIVARIIGKLFVKGAGHCLMEAAESCKQHAKNPKAALDCGKQFLHNNRGRCAVG